MSARPATDRQREIIEMLTRPGATQQTVADHLGIEVQTVKNQLTLAYRTLGVRSVAQAARRLS
ncbi:MAG: LuxR C-terminal-related transcriptional regulator, partial [Candidatus Limnocylindrales bacterium]|nr:LuxR C-terminal-related transcriptional regulator [Candidatus Limnocylindrales bacterium]